METQLWIMYWTGNKFEISPSRISLRHSTYDVTHAMATYFVDAWEEIKNEIFEAYGGLIKLSIDLQMMVYQYNVVLPTCLHFIKNITASPGVFIDALYDLVHVLSIGNRDYFSLGLWFLADLAGLKSREKKIYEETFERNPHLLSSSIGIELFHGLFHSLQKVKAEVPGEEGMNKQSSKFDCLQEVIDFQRRRYGESPAKGGSYSHPVINTTKTGRHYKHKEVAKRVIRDMFKAVQQERVINVQDCGWNKPIVYAEVAVLPPLVIRLGTAGGAWGIDFELKHQEEGKVAGGVVPGVADAVEGADEESTTIIIKSITASAVSSIVRKKALGETAALPGETVLGLVHGAASTRKLIFDARGKSVDLLLSEMHSLRAQKKQINLLIETSSSVSCVLQGGKVKSKARGVWPARANPLVKRVDKALLMKEAATQEGFHRKESDGAKKAWDHPRMQENVRNVQYPKLKSLLARNVTTTLSSDRPTFASDEKYYGTTVKREPEKMTKLCAELHARTSAAGKKHDE